VKSFTVAELNGGL